MQLNFLYSPHYGKPEILLPEKHEDGEVVIKAGITIRIAKDDYCYIKRNPGFVGSLAIVCEDIHFDEKNQILEVRSELSNCHYRRREVVDVKYLMDPKIQLKIILDKAVRGETIIISTNVFN